MLKHILRIRLMELYIFVIVYKSLEKDGKKKTLNALVSLPDSPAPSVALSLGPVGFALNL